MIAHLGAGLYIFMVILTGHSFFFQTEKLPEEGDNEMEMPCTDGVLSSYVLCVLR